MLNFSILGLIITLIFFTGREFIVEWELVEFRGVKITFILIFDFIRTLFFSTVGLIAGRVFMYRSAYILIDRVRHRFLWLVLFFVIRICFLIFRPNLIRLLLGWDGLGVTSYLLVNYYSSEKTFNARILTALTNRLGDIFILLFIALNFIPGIFNSTLISCGLLPNCYFNGLIILAAITKRAQIPFSAWLPAAIAAPTPVSALVHSSTLVTAGVYLLLRFNLILGEGIEAILILGCITITIAGIRGIIELDIKKIIALSTLRQLGVIFFSLGLGESFLRYFHLISHAYFKAIIFICAGAIIHSISDYQDLRKIGAGYSRNPLINGVILVGSVRLCGMPFISGFYSKDQILETMFIYNISGLIFFFTTIATIVTAIYSCRVIIRLFACFYMGEVIIRITDSSAELLWGNLTLIFPSIIGGYCIRGFISRSLTVSLPLWLKIIIMAGVVLRRIIYLFCPLPLITKNKLSLFLNQIWFLPWRMSIINTKSFNFYRKQVIKLSDKSWLSWIIFDWLIIFYSKNYGLQITSSMLIVSYIILLILLITTAN